MGALSACILPVLYALLGACAYVLRTFTEQTDKRTFARNEHFAAVVDWSSLPGNITVDARWYNSFQVVVAQVGPGTPSQLANQTVVPVAVPAGLKYNLFGQLLLTADILFRLDNKGLRQDVTPLIALSYALGH